MHFHISGSWISGTRVPAWSAEVPLLSHSLLAVSTPKGRGQGLLWDLCHKVTNPVHEGFAAQRPNSKPSPWASGFQHMNGVGDGHRPSDHSACLQKTCNRVQRAVCMEFIQLGGKLKMSETSHFPKKTTVIFQVPCVLLEPCYRHESIFFSFFSFFPFSPHCEAYGILVLWPGIKPCPLYWTHRVLTIGWPGKSLEPDILKVCSLHVANLLHCS